MRHIKRLTQRIADYSRRAISTIKALWTLISLLAFRKRLMRHKTLRESINQIAPALAGQGTLLPEQINEPADQKFDHHLKDILTKINIAQFTGEHIAAQIESLVDKGFEYKNQLTESASQQLTMLIEEELNHYSSRGELNEFIKKLDELSLNIEHLQAHVHQLTSGHEIN